MKQMEIETKDSLKRKSVNPPPPPLVAPPLPTYWATTKHTVKAVTPSVTNEEIAKFWRRKRLEEEDHLFAAIKAAARIRARNLTEDDYKCFEESLKEDEMNARKDHNKDENNKELRIGIKDWWTKSKYAYLNQPAIESMDAPKRTSGSTYIPNFCFYKAPTTHPTSLFKVF